MLLKNKHIKEKCSGGKCLPRVSLQKERARRVSGSHGTLSRVRVQDAPGIYLGWRCLKNAAGKGWSGTGGQPVVRTQHTSKASHSNQGRWKLCFMSSVSVMLSQVQGRACETHDIVLPSGRQSTRLCCTSVKMQFFFKLLPVKDV